MLLNIKRFSELLTSVLKNQVVSQDVRLLSCTWGMEAVYKMVLAFSFITLQQR